MALIVSVVKKVKKDGIVLFRSEKRAENTWLYLQIRQNKMAVQD